MDRDEALFEAARALSEVDATDGDWDEGDTAAETRWKHAASYESIIKVETEREDWDAVKYAADRIRTILRGD